MMTLARLRSVLVTSGNGAVSVMVSRETAVCDGRSRDGCECDGRCLHRVVND